MTMTKTQQRTRRHKRVRAKVIGSEARPRLSVYKSNTRLLAQIIDDKSGTTLASVTSLTEKGKTPANARRRPRRRWQSLHARKVSRLSSLIAAGSSTSVLSKRLPRRRVQPV